MDFATSGAPALMPLLCSASRTIQKSSDKRRNISATVGARNLRGTLDQPAICSHF